MLKIFILEDNKERIKRFEKELQFEEFSLTIAESFQDAMEQWGNGGYDIVFLDNDLGGQINMGADEWNSGLNFARHKVDELKQTCVFVHSLNTPRRKDICELVNGTELPFISIPWKELVIWMKVHATND